MNLIKVEGHNSLRKDAQTGAVVNTDRESLMAARRRRDAILAEREKVKSLEDKVAQLESLLNKIIESSQ